MSAGMLVRDSGAGYAVELRSLRAELQGRVLWTRPQGLTSPAIAALRERDERAWNALFESEMPAIYRYVLGRTGRAQEAEDLTSEVFAEAWEHAHTLRDQGSLPRAWLFGIARNLVNSRRRRLLRHPPALTLEAFDYFDEDARLDPRLLDLAEAISRLRYEQAEVIVLRFMHGLSLEETALALNASIDSVKGRQARGLAGLRHRLALPAGAEEIPAHTRATG
jgi:RNA polymerase sigma-70 factor (ECF subfamily)